jgi:type IV secretion system protein VirD4
MANITPRIGFNADDSYSYKDKIKEMKKKAEKLAQTEPDIAFIQLEKIAELISKEIYKKAGYPYIKGLRLDNMIPLIEQNSLVPKVIAIHFNTIRILSSETNEDSTELLNSYIKAALFSLNVIIDWFLHEESVEKLPLFKENLPINKHGSKVQNNNHKLGTSEFIGLEGLNGITGDEGLIISETLRLSREKSMEHCLCVGPTGSGKTASFFIPNLLSLPDASIVVTDPKGELFQKTAATNLAQGKRVLVFNPFLENTLRYNPLSLCRNVSEVRELAQILLANGNAAVEAMTGTKSGGSEWLNMSTPLLAAALLYIKNLSPPKNTISYALELIIDNDIDTLKFLMMDINEDNIWELSAKNQLNIFMQSAESEKTAASIRTVLASSLQLFIDPLIKNATSANEINPKMLREKPTVLYVMIPEYKSATMAPLMAPFFSQLMAHLVDSNSSLPVYFLLDEFANIGLIPNIDTALATFRGRDISISLGIQSLNQLKQKYGKETATSILDNLKTKFILPGLAYDSAEYFTKLLGYKEVITMSNNYDSKEGDFKNISTTPQRRELLSPDEIRRLEDETLIAVVDNRNPFKDRQLRFFSNQDLFKLASNELEINEFMASIRKNNRRLY